MIKRGDIFYVNSGYATGSEQRAGRPAIIVSNDKCNKHSPVLEVVYLTTTIKTSLPTHVIIHSAPRISTALCEQVYGVDISRIGGFCGRCTEQELRAIDIALLISLGLNGWISKTQPAEPEYSMQKVLSGTAKMIAVKGGINLT